MELSFCFRLGQLGSCNQINTDLCPLSTSGSKPANLKWSAMVISFFHYVVGNGHWSRSKLNTLPFLALFLAGQNQEACYKTIGATCE